jgi:hypothetical protein
MRDLNAILKDYELALINEQDEGTVEADEWLTVCRNELLEVLRIAIEWQNARDYANS